MRKFIALLLAAAMVFSLAIVAGADEETTTEETAKATVTLNVTCTGVTDDGVATFVISINAPTSGVAALQFTLEPENMKYVAKDLTDLASVFKPGTAGVQNGDFDFTVKDGVGKYIAYGGEVKAEGGRYLSGTTTLMTVQYQLNDGADSGTLNISEFKACKSGDKAIGADGYICTAPESVTATRPSTGGTTLKGDVNGDDEVDSTDIVYLARYLAGWPDYTIDSVAVADFDNSGAIDSTDIVYFARYLAGWPEYTIN